MSKIRYTPDAAGLQQCVLDIMNRKKKHRSQYKFPNAHTAGIMRVDLDRLKEIQAELNQVSTVLTVKAWDVNSTYRLRGYGRKDWVIREQKLTSEAD